MKKIENGKSAGIDDVCPDFIKYVPDEFILRYQNFSVKIFATRLMS